MPDEKQPADLASPARQRSRIGKRLISGFFDADVLKAWKSLALELDVTVQSLLARAVNDMLEKYGRGRPADEISPARGGAAHQRREKK